MRAESPGLIYGVIELRQYTLRPGSRDAFVALFDAELLESQDATGMRVLGQFRDLDRANVFVWLRGFPDMTTRRRALHGFYDGPVWTAHRGAANGMMVDSDDVLLLEPAGMGPFLHTGTGRPPQGAAPAHGIITARIDPVDRDGTARFAQRYADLVTPALRAAGGCPLALLATLNAVNTFPRLPVREDENVMVSLAGFATVAAANRAAVNSAYQDALASLDDLRTAPGQRLRLTPTPRSALR